MKYGDIKLGHIEALINKLGGKEVVDGILEGRLAVKLVEADRLNTFSTARIPATAKFIVRDHFSTGRAGDVSIGSIGEEFKQHFLFKVEAPRVETKLEIHKLKRFSSCKQILVELHGKEEVTLAEIWELLKRQPNGATGKLLVDGGSNIFFVRNMNGVLMVISIDWDVATNLGWYIGASSVVDPYQWEDGDRVFSRA